MTRSISEPAFVHHRTTYWLALIFACAAAWTPATVLTAAGFPRTAITIRVYQTAGLPSALEQRALTEAEILLQDALVDVRWRKCGLHDAPACAEPLGPSELLLQVVRQETPRQATSATLGHAIVDRRAGGGVLATVYFDRIARLASVAGTDAAVLLGRVAAHELGHLMMRTHAHSHRGLMRPFWTPGEVRRNRAADWAFTARDVAAMRQRGPRS